MSIFFLENHILLNLRTILKVYCTHIFFVIHMNNDLSNNDPCSSPVAGDFVQDSPICLQMKPHSLLSRRGRRPAALDDMCHRLILRRRTLWRRRRRRRRRECSRGVATARGPLHATASAIAAAASAIVAAAASVMCSAPLVSALAVPFAEAPKAFADKFKVRQKYCGKTNLMK